VYNLHTFAMQREPLNRQQSDGGEEGKGGSAGALSRIK